MSKLNSVTIRGYRSIKDATLELRPLNVLIGANGAGKSNLVAFFKMMNELMAGRLREYVASTGHVTSNLHFGPRVTPQMEAELEFETDTMDVDTYRIRLFHAARDSLVFAEECLSFRKPGFRNPRVEQLGAGHEESLIGSTAQEEGPAAKTAGVFWHGCTSLPKGGPSKRSRAPCSANISPSTGSICTIPS